MTNTPLAQKVIHFRDFRIFTQFEYRRFPVCMTYPRDSYASAWQTKSNREDVTCEDCLKKIGEQGRVGKYYVYVVQDGDEPGDYNYGKYHFKYLPLYVGKGSGDRDLTHIYGTSECTDLIVRIRSMVKCPMYDRVLHTDDEGEAYDKQARLIQAIGRYDVGNGPLLNRNRGRYR